MLKNNNHQKYIKYIIIFILATRYLYAEPTKVAYRCKMINGAIGYYDRPCEYMESHGDGIFFGQKIAEETIFMFKSYNGNKNLVNNNIYNFTTNQQPNILATTNKKLQPLTINQLATKRCNNAREKILVIQDLLNNQYINNNNNIEPILAKAKRSLARYKIIKNKYCVE